MQQLRRLASHLAVATLFLVLAVPGCIVEDRVPLVHVTGDLEVIGDGTPSHEQWTSCSRVRQYQVDYGQRVVRHVNGFGPIGQARTSAVVHVEIDVPRRCNEGLALYDVGSDGVGAVWFQIHAFNFTQPLEVVGSTINVDGEVLGPGEFRIFPVNGTVEGRTFQGRVVLDHAGLWPRSGIEVVPAAELDW